MKNFASRTDKVFKNVSISLICQILSLLVGFICRTVFTKEMGAEYLGVSGLFTNILTILSFAELGIGNAIIFRLYAPLAKNDKEQVHQYIYLYKKIYNIIMLIVGVVGIVIIPFLPFIIDAPEISENLIVLYCLYLANTLSSYVFIYKKSLLIADQKDYIVSFVTHTIIIFFNIAQTILLVYNHNYILYLIMNIICTLCGNIVCSIYVNKKYPYLRKKPSNQIERNKIKSLFSDVKGLLLTKIAGTTFGGTDNIFISAFIGIKEVGILSNYTLILTMVNGIMNKAVGAITASIGNLSTLGSKKQVEEVLYKLVFANSAIYSYICVGMALLLQEFVMDIWLTDKFYLPKVVVVLAVFELFLRSTHFPLHTTQNALGLFSQYKIFYVIAAALNIVLDFILVKPLGIGGLIIATILCRGITYYVDIKAVYGIGFKSNSRIYYFHVLRWLILNALCYTISEIVFNFINIHNIFGFIVRILAYTGVYIIMVLVIFGCTSEFQYYIELLRKKVKK